MAAIYDSGSYAGPILQHVLLLKVVARTHLDSRIEYILLFYSVLCLSINITISPETSKFIACVSVT
jgi:hypothetical protein